MTILCGDPNFTGYSVVGPTSTDGGYTAAVPFVASTTGLATSLNCWIIPGPSNAFVMGLYDGTGQQLVYSPPVTVSAVGPVQFPIAGTRIEKGMAYVLLLTCLSGTFQFGIDNAVATQADISPQSNANWPIPLYQLNGGKPSIYGAPAFWVDGDSQARSIFSSGTTGQTVIDTATVIQRAFNRCKIRQNVISDEMIQIARDELFMFLTSDLANRGIQLFAVEMDLLPFTAGQANVPMPAGTIDVLQANVRTLAPLQTSPSTTYSPVSPMQVNTIAITWAGPAVPILIQSNQSGSFQTLLSVTPNASAGETTFYDIDGGQPATGWQVIANPVPPSAGLQVSNVAFYSNLTMVPMAPYSRDDFANLSNLFETSRPFQYWLDRQEPWPIMRLWPVPGINEEENACLMIWRHRHIQDVGELNQRLAVPVRWLTAVIDGLAFRLAKAIVEVNPSVLQFLEKEAMVSLNAVREEEREKAPFRIRPSISRYTR